MTLLLCDFLVVRDGENSVSAPGVSGVRPSRIRHSVAATLHNRDNVTSSTPAQQQNPKQNKEAQLNMIKNIKTLQCCLPIATIFYATAQASEKV
jgi:hypothetical protein